MNIDRMNGIMNTIRHSPSSIREISTFTSIPAPVVEEYVSKLVAEGMATVSHTRKLKMTTITYYKLVDKARKYPNEV